MKMIEKVNDLKKEYVFEQYTRIVEKFKDYEKVTKKQMLEEIYKVYSDYNNIIDICTVRELKYLKLIINSKKTVENDKKEYLDEKYKWERSALHSKFIIEQNFDDQIYIPEEIEKEVEEAIKHVEWDKRKKIDELNEILVGQCKMQGTALLDTIVSFGSMITGVPEDVIKYHMFNNKLFNYYVFIESRYYEELKRNIDVLIYNDYYNISDVLDEERKKQGIAGSKKIDTRIYKTLFYNDFDINNPIINKFLEEIKKLHFFWFEALDYIREYAMLNIDRRPLKESIKSVLSLKNQDLTEFFKLMDKAMDEMPSGALNGFTPNEARKIKLEEIKLKFDKETKYKKQQNACLSKKDAKLFYKIYFGLLEFTNNKYKINPMIKIYNQNGINPYEIKPIVEMFWKKKDTLVLEFCLANPYKFNKEELEVTSEFKKGFRDMFIITKYEEEYTAIMNKNKIYMIKGINDNIDNVISYEDLPYVCFTSIIPFKGVLIYDGLFEGMDIKLGNNFDKMIEEDYKNSMKYYHL